MLCTPPPPPSFPFLAQATTLAHLLYESAVLESGFTLEDPRGFSARVHGLVRGLLNVEEGAEAEVEAGGEEGGEEGVPEKDEL